MRLFILDALRSFGWSNLNLSQLADWCGVRLITVEWYSSSDEALVWVSRSQSSCYKRSVPTESKVRKRASVFWEVLPMTPTYLYRLSPMTAGCEPGSEIPNETKEKGSLTEKITQHFYHSHVFTPVYEVSVSFLIYSMCHDKLCDWLTQSGDCVSDWKLSPLIAFSEVIKTTSVALCWLCELLRQVLTKASFDQPSMELITAFTLAVNTLLNQSSLTVC